MTQFASANRTFSACPLYPELAGVVSWTASHNTFKSWEQVAAANPPARGEGTGTRFLLHEAGCGSVVLSSLAENLRSRYPKSNATGERGVIVLRCGLGGESSERAKSSGEVALDLVHQILCQMPHLYGALGQHLAMFEEEEEACNIFGQHAWTLLRLLVVTADFPRVICCVDSTEDTPSSCRTKEKILKRFVGLQEENIIPLDLVVLDRSFQSGDGWFKPTHVIDLADYRPDKVRLAKELFVRSALCPELRSEVVQVLDKSTSMVGLAVGFHYLSHHKFLSSRSANRQQLDVLGGLSEIYKHILGQILGDQQQEWARQVLSCVLFSFRPLRCAELAVAVAQGVSDEIPLAVEDDLRRVFGRLLVIEDGVVRLVHPTLRDFLLQPHPPSKQWFNFSTLTDKKDEHQSIVRACLKVLSGAQDLTEDALGSLGDERSRASFNHQHPFAQYASCFWERHYEEYYSDTGKADHPLAPSSGIKLQNDVEIFLESEAAQRWCKIRQAVGRFMTCPERESGGCDCACTPLQHAATLGLANIVKSWLDQRGRDIDDGDRLDALRLACKVGHVETVRYILESGIPSLKNEPPSESHQNLITECVNFAAQRGFHATLDLLLPIILPVGSEVKWRKEIGAGALSLASMNGHLNTVKRLISNGVHVNEHVDKRMLALTGAAACGHLGVVRYLITHGADLSLTDGPEGKETALIEAAHHVRPISIWITWFLLLTELSRDK